MDFLCTALVQEFRCLTQLGAPHDGVVDEQQLLSADQSVHRNQLHAGDQVSLSLVLGHEGARPGGGVFDEGTGKWNAGFIGIPDGVGDA